MLPSREELLAKAAALPEPPVAFGACWDGDTEGWFVILYAMLSGERCRYLPCSAAAATSGFLPEKCHRGRRLSWRRPLAQSLPSVMACHSNSHRRTVRSLVTSQPTP